MTAFQAPVTYPVSASPVRIAGPHTPPFRIINNGETGTVWISENSGIEVGQGTPIHAGTSLNWVKLSDIWAISDTDTTVIVTNEIDDWQPDPTAIAVATATALFESGVPYAVKSEVIYNGSLAGPGNQLNINNIEPGMRALFVSVSISSALPVNPVELTIIAISTLGASFRSLYIRNGFGSPWQAVIPANGEIQQVLISYDNSVTYNLSLEVANTSVPRLAQRSVSGMLTYRQEASIAASGSVSYNLPPWIGEVEIRSTCSKNGGNTLPPQLRIDTYYGTAPSVVYNGPDFRESYFPVQASGTAYRWGYKERFLLSGAYMTVNVFNIDAANAITDFGLVVVPTSESML